MKQLVESPLRKNHYDFMKAFLPDNMHKHVATLEKKTASDDERAQALKKLNEELNKDLAELNKQLQAAQQQAAKDAAAIAQLEANIQKVENVLNTLNAPEKKKAYDSALKHAKTNAYTVINTGKDKSTTLIALVPLEDIQNTFNTFIAEQKKNWQPSKGPFPEGSFTSSLDNGPPRVLTLTFPDEASAKAFIQHLFKNNMAMFPNGSQDINDFDAQQSQAQQQQEESSQLTQDFKKQMEAVKGVEAEENTPQMGSRPTPRPYSN